MSPWTTGRSEIDDLIAAGEIARTSGADSTVEPLMRRAREELSSGLAVADSDYARICIVAYAAAQYAALALLAQQGLSTQKTDGEDKAIERALTAQFRGLFDSYGLLCRRRSDLDRRAGTDALVDPGDPGESSVALHCATRLVNQAQTILDQRILTIY